MFPLRHHVRTGLNRIFLHRANVHWTKLRSDDITVPDQEHDLPEKLWDSFLCDIRICPCSLINAPATTIMMDTLCCSAQHVDKHQKSCSPNYMCGAGTHNRKCKACENACIVPESLQPSASYQEQFQFLTPSCHIRSFGQAISPLPTHMLCVILSVTFHVRMMELTQAAGVCLPAISLF